MEKSRKDSRILLKIAIVVIILMSVVGKINLYARVDENNNYDFYEEATGWFKLGGTNTFLSADVLSKITSIIEIVGTGVIAVVAIVLGIKYMLGSVSGKAEVKEQLITFLVACMFFFGWSNIRDLLITTTNGTSIFDNEGAVTNNFTGKTTQLFIFQGSGTIEGAFAQVFAIVVFIGKVIAVIATMWIGVKYILSGADGKAELKQKGVMYIIGIILIFSTLNFLTFISSAVSTMFAK